MTDLSYHDWIDYVFDHAVPFMSRLVSGETRIGGDPRPEQAIEYLTRLFENPEALARSVRRQPDRARALLSDRQRLPALIAGS